MLINDKPVIYLVGILPKIPDIHIKMATVSKLEAQQELCQDAGVIHHASVVDSTHSNIDRENYAVVDYIISLIFQDMINHLPKHSFL